MHRVKVASGDYTSELATSAGGLCAIGVESYMPSLHIGGYIPVDPSSSSLSNALAPPPDLAHALHRRHRLGHQLAVVAHGHVAPLRSTPPSVRPFLYDLPSLAIFYSTAKWIDGLVDNLGT